ncbi:MYND-type zinc finger-containing chromatin reader ZMYND8-like isoform X2 [Sitodiplosis mosellana]|uniref:MYND-type zinc finger-containing chromatin reader ZMYND8-like isoform X2 n=1 Tax=Sitodiplosis mosellana TaxID=263140 RepID=UPI002443C13F|nr:MYND-type zinc finger-containing chromatin reader ZMYND8-like isoform X2 [Sitodiplosis mosellana]
MQPFGGSGRHRKQPEADNYCWTCHRDDTEQFCTTCVRSFHESSSCSRAKGLSQEELMTWRCHECLDIEKGAEQNKTENITAAQLKKVLNYIFQKLITDDRTFAKPFMSIEYPRGTVVNTMDLNTMERKIEIGAYSCCEDFWSDIKWIVHNTKIHSTADYETIRAARLLFNTAKEETYSIRMCHECYLNDNDFTAPCSIPHLLVWAKQRTYPHWPAKLIRYNSMEHTVDVLYFCENHLRAILPAKDCLLYSQQCPSLAVGNHKNAFNNALKEAEQYINNITKKYGSFYYADPITVLHCNQLERHLYDTIPNAWKELGRSVVPPSIVKPVPASATSARRMSMPVHRNKRSFAPPPFVPGRIMTRRMSSILNESFVAEEEKTEKPKKATVYRRQSVQVDRLPSQAINSTARVSKAKVPTEAIQSAAKKRRMSLSLNLEGPSAKSARMASDANRKKATSGPFNSMTLQPDSKSAQNPSSYSVFKVPTVPKMRKSAASTKQPSQDNSTNNDLIAAIDRDLTKTLSQSARSAKEQNGFDQKTMKVSPPKPNPKKNQAFNRNVGCSVGMVALCKAAVEKDTEKMVESVRLSLSDTLFNCLNTTKSQNDQSLPEQLEKQRSNYDQMITGLRHQNRDLEASIKSYTENHSKKNQTRKNANDVNDLKVKFDATAADLAKTQAKLADVNDQMGSLMKKNMFLNATINKLQTTNFDQANSLNSERAKNAHLVNVNKNLMDGNAKLNLTLDNLSAENKRLICQMKEQQAKNESMKNQAYEHYARMITDIKKKQWCATCGMPGGQYFCSAQCDEYARSPYYH